jgi:hypothetical protein
MCNKQKVVKESQETRILRHLMSEGSITGVEAAAIYKVRSLTKRISTLVDRGAHIDREWRKDMTGQRYVRYRLIYCPRSAHARLGLL